MAWAPPFLLLISAPNLRAEPGPGSLAYPSEFKVLTMMEDLVLNPLKEKYRVPGLGVTQVPSEKQYP